MRRATRRACERVIGLGTHHRVSQHSRVGYLSVRDCYLVTPYARGVTRHGLWRAGEERVISVTPVARGVVRPFLLTVTTVAMIAVGATRYPFVHATEWWLLLVAAGPFAVVTMTRTWRWRSFKVHVTNERVVLEGGVSRRTRSSIELRDVYASRVDQRVLERIARRGLVVLETGGGPVVLGLLREPGALCRLIDAERSSQHDPVGSVTARRDFDAHRGTASRYASPRPAEWRPRRYE